MIVLVALAAALSGLGLVSTLDPPERRSELALRLCLAALLGLGVTSAAFGAALLALRHAGGGSDLAVAFAGAALLAVTRARGLWVAHRSVAPVAETAAPWELRTGVALAALFIAAMFVEHSIRYPDGGWDATAIWNLRARALARAPDRLDLVFARELEHTDYPLLVPALLAHLWRTLGFETAAVPVALHGLFVIMAVAVPALALAARRTAASGLCAAVVLLGTPALLSMGWSQYMDVPLAAFLVAAAVFADGRSLLLAGLSAGLAAWTKNEGLLALAALAIAVLATGVARAPRGRALLAFLAGAAFPLALLAVFKLRFAPPNDVVAATTLEGLRARVLDPSRLTYIMGSFASRLWRFEDWGLALGGVAAAWAFIAALRRPVVTEARRPALACALLLLAYAGVYLVTPHDLGWHVRASLDRLLFQLFPTAVLATGLALIQPPQSETGSPLLGPR